MTDKRRKPKPVEQQMKERLALDERLRDNDLVLHEALKEICESLDLSKTDLAKIGDLSRPSIASMMSADGNPKLTSVTDVLKCLGYKLVVKPVV